jgi:hypothetical protein
VGGAGRDQHQAAHHVLQLGRGEQRELPAQTVADEDQRVAWMLSHGALNRFGNQLLDDLAIAKVIAGRCSERARTLAGHRSELKMEDGWAELLKAPGQAAPLNCIQIPFGRFRGSCESSALDEIQKLLSRTSKSWIKLQTYG